MTESCCPTKLPAQPTEYEGKGRIQDDNSYMTNVNQEKERAILMIHDIFGITPQAKQVADLMSEKSNSCVYVKHQLREQRQPLEGLPNRTIMDYISKEGSQDRVKHLLDEALKELKDEGYKKIACLGFCWGAMIGVYLQQEKQVIGLGCAHPTQIEDGKIQGEKNEQKGPVFLLLSNDEKDHTRWEEAIKNSTDENISRISCVQRYNSFHGFMGARANFNTDVHLKDMQNGIDIQGDFFNKLFSQQVVGFPFASIGISINLVFLYLYCVI